MLPNSIPLCREGLIFLLAIICVWVLNADDVIDDGDGTLTNHFTVDDKVVSPDVGVSEAVEDKTEKEVFLNDEAKNLESDDVAEGSGNEKDLYDYVDNSNNNRNLDSEEYIYDTRKLLIITVITFGAVIIVCICGALGCGFCISGKAEKAKYVSHA